MSAIALLKLRSFARSFRRIQRDLKIWGEVTSQSPLAYFSDYRKIASAAKDHWFSKFDESSGEKIKCLW